MTANEAPFASGARLSYIAPPLSQSPRPGEEPPRMAKKRSEPRKTQTPTTFEQARDELFSHILRCGVLEAGPEHQKESFDDTMLYLAYRFVGLSEDEIAQLRLLG